MTNASHAKTKPEDAVKAIKQGADFYLYKIKNDDTIKKTYFLFYDSYETRSGTIKNNGDRIMSGNRRIFISKLTDILVGKHTAILKSDKANNANVEHCMALRTKNQTIHLEATSKNKYYLS